MFGLKIKPTWPKGPMPDSPRPPPTPPQLGLGLPPHHFPVRLPLSAARQPRQAGCQGHFLFFSPTNFAPEFCTRRLLSSPRAGGGEVKAGAAWEGNLGVREPGGIRKLGEECVGPAARLWALWSPARSRRCC